MRGANGRGSCSPRSPRRRSEAGRPLIWSGSPGRRAPASPRCSPRWWTSGGEETGRLPCSPSIPPPSAPAAPCSATGCGGRIDHDPKDEGILIRSTAAGGRLGGLAAPTREAVDALAAAFDLVVVETVGVGQSETDVEEVCDTVAVVVQPGSGDTLQFIKAGIMEVPDVLVVTKADLGDAAVRARRDLDQALAAGGSRGAPGGAGSARAPPLAAVGSRDVPVIAVSSVPPPTGIDELADALDAHRASLGLGERRV